MKRIEFFGTDRVAFGLVAMGARRDGDDVELHLGPLTVSSVRGNMTSGSVWYPGAPDDSPWNTVSLPRDVEALGVVFGLFEVSLGEGRDAIMSSPAIDRLASAAVLRVDASTPIGRRALDMSARGEWSGVFSVGWKHVTDAWRGDVFVDDDLISIALADEPWASQQRLDVETSLRSRPELGRVGRYAAALSVRLGV